MRLSRPSLSAALLAASLLVSGVTFGQGGSPAPWTAEEINKDRVSIVLNSLELTPEESAALRPIYTEYRMAMDRFDQQIDGILIDFGKSYADLSDAKAGELMDKWLAIEEGRMSNRNDYYARMREVLPAKTVLRLAQMESKMDTIVRMDYVRSVPVAR